MLFSYQGELMYLTIIAPS